MLTLQCNPNPDPNPNPYSLKKLALKRLLSRRPTPNPNPNPYPNPNQEAAGVWTEVFDETNCNVAVNLGQVKTDAGFTQGSMFKYLISGKVPLVCPSPPRHSDCV